MGKVRSKIRRAGSLAVLIAASIFSVTPIAWMLVTSFKEEGDLLTADFQVLPRTITFENYMSVWRQSHLPLMMMNSLAVSLLTVITCVVVGIFAAYALARGKFRGKTIVMIVYLLVRMLPPVLLVIPLFALLRGFGLLDTQLGLALAYSSFVLPNFVWMARSFIEMVPGELDEAARVDGASRITAMLRIAVPLSSTGLITAGAFVAILAWNEFILALLLTTSLGSRTWPVGLQLMIGEFQLPWGTLAAGGTLSIVPTLLLFAVFGKNMLDGFGLGKSPSARKISNP